MQFEVRSEVPNESTRRLTVADLGVLPSDLPSGTVLYELDNGRLITLPPHTEQHGAVVANLAGFLMRQAVEPGHGKACIGGVGVVLWRNPDRVVGADAIFIGNDKLPVQVSAEDYVETAPDLVAEVRERSDSLAALERKVQDYLSIGVRVVWLVDPISRKVTEHRPEREPRVYGEDDVLTVEDVIPGFRLSVRDALQE